MPYRRLPNTDAARLKAMTKAINMNMKLPSHELAFSHLTLQKLNTLHPQFEHVVLRQKEAFKAQTQRSKQFAEKTKKAKLYLSHFIQVMNFMILRGELPETDRSYFGLKSFEKSLPPLMSEADLLTIGKQIVEGDQERQKFGGKIITNPTAAVVRVHYEDFRTAYIEQKNLQKQYALAQQNTANMRNNVDEIILQLWNEVENKFSDLPDDIKREKASEYGVVYFYRPNERKKITQQQLSNQRAEKLKQAGQKKEAELNFSEHRLTVS